MKRDSSNSNPAIPDDLTAELALHPAAMQAFVALPPSHQREYLKWIAEAKKPETRRRRVEKAVQMVLGLSSGK